MGNHLRGSSREVTQLSFCFKRSLWHLNISSWRMDLRQVRFEAQRLVTEAVETIRRKICKNQQFSAPSQSISIPFRWSRGFMDCKSPSSCLSVCISWMALEGLCLCDPCLREFLTLSSSPVDPVYHQILLFLPSNYLIFVSLSQLLCHCLRPAT